MSAARRRAYHPKTQVLTHGKSRSDFRKHVADQKSLRRHLLAIVVWLVFGTDFAMAHRLRRLIDLGGRLLTQKSCEDCHAPLDALGGSPQQQPTDSTRSLRLISTIEWGANPMETTGSQEKLPLLPMQDRADLVVVDLSIDGQAISPGARERELRCRFGVIDVL